MITRVSPTVVRVSKRHLAEVKSNRSARELSISILQGQIGARRFSLQRFIQERSSVIL